MKLSLGVYTADALSNPGIAGAGVLELLFWLSGQLACTALPCIVMGVDAEAPLASEFAVGVWSCGYASEVS